MAWLIALCLLALVTQGHQVDIPLQSSVPTNETMLMEFLLHLKEQNDVLAPCGLGVVYDSQALNAGLNREVIRSLTTPFSIFTLDVSEARPWEPPIQQKGVPCTFFLLYFDGKNRVALLFEWLLAQFNYLQAYRYYYAFYNWNGPIEDYVQNDKRQFKYQMAIDRLETDRTDVVTARLTWYNFFKKTYVRRYDVTSAAPASGQLYPDLWSDLSDLKMYCVEMNNLWLDNFLYEALRYKRVRKKHYFYYPYLFAPGDTLKHDLYVDFGVTRPYRFSQLVAVSKKNPATLSWKLLFQPLSWQVWLGLGLGLGLVTFFVWAMGKRGLVGGSSPAGFLFGKMCPALAGQGVTMPDNPALGWLLCFWFFFCVVLTTTYTAKMVELIMNPTSTNIQSAVEMVEKGFKFYGGRTSYFMIMAENAEDPFIKKLAESVDTSRDMYEPLSKIHKTDQMAVIVDEIILDFTLSRDYDNLYHSEDLHTVPSMFTASWKAAAMVRGIDIYERIDAVVASYFENGFMLHDYYMANKWYRERMLRYRYLHGTLQDDRLVRISMQQVRVPLCLLAAGLILAAMSVVHETWAILTSMVRRGCLFLLKRGSRVTRTVRKAVPAGRWFISKKKQKTTRRYGFLP